jgi:uncharacterized protein (DUF305 family)
MMKRLTCRQFILAGVVSSALGSSAVLAEGMAGMHHTAPANAVNAPANAMPNSFASMMDNSMEAMNTGMAKAPMNSDPDHDFAAMMVPHHQGAVDMAKAELLYGKNPVLRRLAQEIIVTQGDEIRIMQLELKKLPPQAR